ncbi:MAG: sugar phosphate isomerase/epimerase [Pirellulales bacterium]|nr:sugar phosphate isomerase/epimerase [Pirellulales bacterium]
MTHSMRFAICNEMFVGWSFERTFAAIRALGYDGVEMAPFTFREDAEPFRLDEVSESEWGAVRDLAEAAGIQIVGLHWLFARTEGLYLTSPEAAIRQRTADYLIKLAQLCQALGGQIMVLGSPQQRNLLPGVSHEAAVGYATDVIRRAMPVLTDCGVTLAVEPLSPAEGNFLTTAEAGRGLVASVRSPNCRLHLDVKAMSSESTPIPEIIRASRNDLAHFHANDPNLLGPGMGDVDFGPIFDALREIDYQGWISVEPFDRSIDPVRIAEKSMHYMRSFTG